MIPKRRENDPDGDDGRGVSGEGSRRIGDGSVGTGFRDLENQARLSACPVVTQQRINPVMHLIPDSETVTADEIRGLRDAGSRTIDVLNDCDMALAALRGEFGAGVHRAEQALARCAERIRERDEQLSGMALGNASVNAEIDLEKLGSHDRTTQLGQAMLRTLIAGRLGISPDEITIEPSDEISGALTIRARGAEVTG